MLVVLLTSIVAPSRAGQVAVGVSQPLVPTQAVDLDPGAAGFADVEQAIKSFEKGEFEASIQHLARARATHPELAPPHALLAKLAFLRNQSALIRPALERSIAEDSGHPEVFILFGNLALTEGRVTDAAVHFEKAKALAGGQRWTAEQRSRFTLRCDQGMAVVSEGRADWKGARAALEAWLEREPTNGPARQRLGKALFELGDSDAAHKALLQATRDDPRLEPANVVMGWLFARSGNVEKAGEWMEYAARIEPNSLTVQLGVAAWLLEQGRGDEAQSHLDVAARLDPRSNEVRRMIGLTARQRKDLVRAEQVFQALADESPADAWARNQLALVLAEQDDQAKRRRAIDLAELSVKQDSKAVNTLSTLGTVYYRFNRRDDAEKVLQAVVASGKGDSDAAYILARVKAERGHPDEALPLLKKALAATGLFVARKDAEHWLDQLKTAMK